MKQALTIEDLMKYFSKRETAMSELDKELNGLAKTLLDLIPSELNKFAAECMYLNGYLNAAEWLQGLYDGRESDRPASDSIREFRDYGFKGKADAVQKMSLLKKAWKGLIDISLGKHSGCLEVSYRLAEYSPTKSK